MKAPIPEQNIAGTFVVEVNFSIVAKSRKAIDEYLIEAGEAMNVAAVKVGNKKKHPLTVRAVHVALTRS